MSATYFISDLHFGLQDAEREQAKLHALEQLCELIKQDGKALYMLGDIMDYWLEFRHVMPKGFTKLFCLLSDLVRYGIKITYFAGNHDFYLGRYFDDELGITTRYGLCEEQIDGYRFVLAHGDGLGDGDVGYKLFARFVRNPMNRSLLRYIHPDVTIGLMQWLSQLSRNHKPVNIVLEVDRLLHFANALVAEREFDYFICGHNHVKSVNALAARPCSYINLGTWIDGTSPYGYFKDGHFQLKEL